MKKNEIKREDLILTPQKAVKNAIRKNKALKFNYKTIEDGQIIEVTADGAKKILGKSKYGTVQSETDKH